MELQEVTKIQTGDEQQLHMFPQILMQSSYLFAKYKKHIPFDVQKPGCLSSLLTSVIFWKVWEHIWLIKSADDKSLTHLLECFAETQC